MDMRKLQNYTRTNESLTSNIFDIEMVDNVLIQLGYDPNTIKKLGEGMYGLGLDAGDKVIKITSDSVEAKYAKQLMDITSDHLIKVYDVREIEYLDIKGIYVIVEEKLNTHLNKTILSMLWYLEHVNPFRNIIGKKDISDESILEFYKGKLLQSDENILHIFKEITKVFTEAQQYDLPTHEIRDKNIGARNNNLVYFDISDPYEAAPQSLDLPKIIIRH